MRGMGSKTRRANSTKKRVVAWLGEDRGVRGDVRGRPRVHPWWEGVGVFSEGKGGDEI